MLSDEDLAAIFRQFDLDGSGAFDEARTPPAARPAGCPARRSPGRAVAVASPLGPPRSSAGYSAMLLAAGPAPQTGPEAALVGFFRVARAQGGPGGGGHVCVRRRDARAAACVASDGREGGGHGSSQTPRPCRGQKVVKH